MRTRQHGFVLVLVLGLLAIAATTLAMTARRQFRSALEAVQAEEDLQRRWLVRSAEEVVLDRVPQILATRDDKNGDPSSPAPSRRWLELETPHFAVRLKAQDEQSKLNLNAALSQSDVQALAKRLAQLPSLRERASDLMLRPIEPFDRQLNAIPQAWPAFIGFDQVLANPSPQDLIGAPDNRDPSIGDGLTLWGDGRVNIHTASPQVLAAALMPDLDAVRLRRLVENRQTKPDLKLSELLKPLGLTTAQQRRVAARLADASTCYSLWLVMSNADRSWYYGGVRSDWAQATAATTRLRW